MEYKWRVKKSERGISLENFIYKKLGDWSHKQVKTSIDNKRAFINGRNVFISKWNLKPNDLVLFAPAKGDLQKTQKGRYRFIDVLYEDSYLISTNKPAYAEFEEYAGAVQDYLKRKNKVKSYPYLGQMHRLDKETTGVMIYTKKKSANSLADQFRAHKISKSYLALVDGRVSKEQGTIKKFLEKGDFEEGKKVRIAQKPSKGLSAVTIFQVVERYANATLLQVEILTGRTHQIRVHLSDMGHPIVGDKLYGNPEGIDFRRQALHAEKLAFKHPVTHQKTKIIAPVAEDMAKLIDELRDAA